MARLSMLSLIFVLVLICYASPSLEARKLLSMEKRKVPSLVDNLVLSALPEVTTPPSSPSAKEARKLMSMEKGKVPSLEDNLVLSALPKGTTPPSPNAKGLNGRLFTLHLGHIDRLLQSVPSPGIGH
ncbi:hypothetical protein F0562_009022 [Nyssa sinensis]|uniref:Precursor of CEP14 n=1 Tax=Nyssa sinensis TaxID=561372 RepID=A0A5J5A8V4_9ASTE|nr:hypothetical protein F0562_009022 [Nyssa sinensis]